MSHHFDTKLAKEDPRLNICDFYLFEGSGAGRTVIAMTVNPASDALHEEGLYSFRFDSGVVFHFRFAGRSYVVRRGEDLLVEGEIGKVAGADALSAYVGAAHDLFAGDAIALRAFLKSYYEEQRFYEDAFLNRQNFFAERKIVAIVLEVPTDMIGSGLVHAWATISLFGHAPETPVSRWGLPLISNLCLNNPKDQQWKELYNATGPSSDVANLSGPLAEFVEKMVTYAGSAGDPAAYGKEVAARLCPVMLPYELGSAAAFRLEKFNGRALGDDVMDVMLSIVANKALEDGVAPDTSRIGATFPYFPVS